MSDGSAKSSGSVGQSSSSSVGSSHAPSEPLSSGANPPAGSSPYPSSSMSCTCDVQLFIVGWGEFGTNATVQAWNFGTCDLVGFGFTDNPAIISPSGSIGIPPGGYTEYTITTTPEQVEGTTFYVETNYCGTPSIYIEET